MGLNFFDGHPLEIFSSLMNYLSLPEKEKLTQNFNQITTALIKSATQTPYIVLAFVKDFENSAANAANHSIDRITKTMGANPIVQKTITKTSNVSSFSHAVKATITDKSRPLADVPRPVINHSKLRHTHNHANDSNETAIFPLGHATPIRDMEIVLKENDEIGIDTVIVPLPKMDGHEYAEDGRTIDEVNDDHMKATVLNPNWPVYKDIPKHHKISLITHSSSTASFERVTKKYDDLAKFARARFSNIIHHGALLETVGSSFLFNPIKSKTYKIASATPWLKDKKVGSTPIDLHHLKIPNDICQDTYQAGLENNAEHGQAHWLKKACQRHLKSIIRDNETTSHFQQMERTFYSGTNENAACYKTVEYYARVLVEGAESEIIEGAGHNLMLESKAFRKRVVDIIKNNKEPRISMDEITTPLVEQTDKLPENSWLSAFKESLVNPDINKSGLKPQAAASADAPTRAPQAV